MDAALDYLNRGLSILPLAKDKKPLIQWQEFQTRQPTELEVRQWFKQWPDMNIGIVTGKLSGLTVIDCDSQLAIEYFYSGYKGKTPNVKTPRGMHFYFKYQEGVRNTAKLTEHIDVRSEGGYVVAPPSVNGEGNAYRFINDLNNALDSFNNCFLYKEYLTNSSYSNFSFNNIRHIRQDSSMWEHGKRDDSLFHTANCLVKGGMQEDEIFQVLRPIVNAWGEDDPKWINTKIQSAIERSKRRDRNLTQEILEYIDSSSGIILSSEVVNFLHCSSLAEKKNVSQIMRRLEKEGRIQKEGNRNGHWRIVENDIEFMDWRNAPTDEYKMDWPLGIGQLVKLYPSNIAIIAGASNTGKTTFLLEIVRLNMRQRKVRYINSEMGPNELRLRIEMFAEVTHPDKWNFEAVPRSSNFADVVDPDGFNVIDFMEIYDEFWKIGGWIKDIHEKLKTGIAIIAIQKQSSTQKNQKDFGRGGELTIEKPRLYLAMDRGKIKIVKAKIWRNHERNPNGLIRDFNIISGWKFKPKGDDWYTEEEQKYSRFKSLSDPDFPHED